MLKLRTVPKAMFNVVPIAWGSLPKRYLNPGELEVLIAMVRSVNARSVLEIGVNSGRTARALLDNVPTIEHYQGIDVTPGYSFACKVQRNEVPPRPGLYALDDPRFELILRRRGSFDLTPSDLRRADVVFIDGDHGRAAVTRDSALAEHVVRPGGLIIWHDYHDLGNVDVRDVLHERAPGFNAEVLHIEGTWIAFQSVPQTPAGAPCDA